MRQRKLIFKFFLVLVIGQFAIESWGQNNPTGFPIPKDFISSNVFFRYIRKITNEGRLAEADSLLQATLSAQDIPSDDLIRGNAFHFLGMLRFEEGQPDLAKSLLDSAYRIRAQRLGANWHITLQSANSLAGVLRDLEEYDRSLALYRKVTQAKSPMNIVPSRIIALNGIGHNYMDLGNFEKAYQFYREALDSAITNYGVDSPELSFTYSNLGAAHQANGNFREAIVYYQNTIDLLAEKPFDINLVTHYNGIGNCYYELRDMDKAISYHLKALEILREHYPAGSHHFGITYNHLGRDYGKKGDYQKEEAYYTLALQLFKNKYSGGHTSLITINSNLARNYLIKGDTLQAEFLFQEALENNPRQSRMDTIKLAYSLSDLAILYQNQARYKKANEYFEAASELINATRAKDHPRNVSIQSNLALNLTYLKRYHSAIEKLREVIDHLNTTDKYYKIRPLRQYYLLGNCYRALGQVTKAEEAYHQALEAITYNRAQLGALHDPETQISALWAIAAFYNEQGRQRNSISLLRKAHNLYGQAFELWDNIGLTVGGESRSILSSNYYYIFADAAQNYLQLYQKTDSIQFYHQAFRCAERSKSLRLLETMQESRALAFSGIPDSLLRQEEILRAAITKKDLLLEKASQSGAMPNDTLILRVRKERAQLREAYDNYKALLEKDYPRYFAAKFPKETVSPLSLGQQLLLDNQCMLEYLEGENEIIIFVIRKDTVLDRTVPKDFSLEQAIVEMTAEGIFGFHNAPPTRRNRYLRQQTVSSYTRAGKLLYEKLWKPVEQYLKEDVIIIPDGLLHQIPFEALLTDVPASGGNFSEYPFLLLQHQISYGPSATLLMDIHQQATSDTRDLQLLAMAPFVESDLAFPFEEKLPVLKASGTGVNQINSIFPGKALQGKLANQDAFLSLASGYRLIHLSTHAKANRQNGDFTYLTFADPSGQQAYTKLYAREIYNHRLEADLIFLSACETGIGQLRRGEGVINFVRAFTFAGAKSIFTTLWPIYDEKTEELSVSFYRNLKRGKNKRQALHDAKLEFIRAGQSDPAYAHPFFWAAFIGIGDMQALTF